MSTIKSSTMMADHLWSEFLSANRAHFSYREFARRTWRDGECFLRLFAESEEGPTLRFLDPETIGETSEHPGTQGILTAAGGCGNPHRLFADRSDFGRTGGTHSRRRGAAYCRINADSNQKRGLTWFAPVLETLGQFERWLETTLIARKLQASIVLWRKVTGGTDSSIVADVGERGPIYDSGSVIPREKYRAGTILTTSEGTDLQYLNPTTNFRDGVPLGRLMLLCAAAGSGLPEYMLTSDASNANYASTLVAEGPAVKLFHSEQLFFAGEWNRLWRWAMSQFIAAGQLPANTFERIKPEWTFPDLAVRDRPQGTPGRCAIGESGHPEQSRDRPPRQGGPAGDARGDLFGAS